MINTILRELGIETVPPVAINHETIAIGAQYAPETACFPFKVCLGGYIQAIQRGADTVLMAGGSGPCRFGIYAEVQRSILTELGYKMDFIILEPIQGDGRRLWNELHWFLGWKRLGRLPAALRLAWHKLIFLEDLDDLSHKYLPREINPGSVQPLIHRYRKAVEETWTIEGIHRLSSRLHEELDELPIDREKRLLQLKVGGEIFMVLEPGVNYHIEEVLAGMGVEVHRNVKISHWARESLFKFFHRREINGYRLDARNYLRCFAGGHAQFTVADAVRAGIERMDGMIQIMPFTCMPEIVAQTILPEIGQDWSLPILTLVLDEHSGEAGIRTRLEAFVDLARRRRRLEVTG